MKILLMKFGTLLVSRQTGVEAYNAFKPNLKLIKEKENIVVDFEGVTTFTPSWGDEFLTQLVKRI